jgi:enoyl-CoA hydratase
VNRVLLEVNDGVALVTVNDPERRNAVTDDISTGLRLAIEKVQPIRTSTR